MAVGTELQYAKLDELKLDPFNPRLGRHQMGAETSQEELMEIMSAWVLDELACSYLESGGFWSHEPLVVVRGKLYRCECLVVVEGNRRLSALLHLRNAFDGTLLTKKWEKLIDGQEVPTNLFEKIPYVLADSRDDIQAFLGFRHVTGIKPWDADEKAAFIAKLIDKSNLTYQEVARRIGSRFPAVRRHYVAYKVLLQIEKNVEDFEPKKAEKRFAILYMSLDTAGVQEYLGIDSKNIQEKTDAPIPKEKINQLVFFSKWLFGTKEKSYLIPDTRLVSDFSTILQSSDAVEYLEGADSSSIQPKLEVAFRIAGGDEPETVRYISEAAQLVELALMRAHAFKDSKKFQEAVNRLKEDVSQLVKIFSDK